MKVLAFTGRNSRKGVPMLIRSMFVAIAILASSFHASAQVGRNSAEYNLSDSVGLKGFDPVAIFPEGGGVAIQGKAELSHNYSGVVYRFSSAENLLLFLQNPLKYEPTYGGWCAFAMASGSKVDIQPHLFTIHGNRAHYFVAARAKQNFDRDILNYENRADRNWMQISGEEPRQ